jgi:predicted RNA binding protein YcfA (HicA-like mRNA interferase family)
MSEKLPRISAEKLIKVLGKMGFVLVRQSGSHMIYKKGNTRVTVPYHSGKTIHPKILRTILKDINLTIKEFKELM